MEVAGRPIDLVESGETGYAGQVTAWHRSPLQGSMLSVW